MGREMETETLGIVKYPHESLTTLATAIGDITSEHAMLATEMIRLMIDHNGVGLAANQVGKPVRMFVAHVPRPPTTMPNRVCATPFPMTYINPRIVGTQGRPVPYMEGCLSQPGVQVLVKRPAIVTMEYTDLGGRVNTATAFGLLARVWQHEIDHLNGINIGKGGSK